MTTPSRPLLAILVLAATAAPALLASAAPPTPGRYEELGEDGRIFVPDEPPLVPAYLPPASLGDYHNASEAVDAVLALAAARPDLLSVRTAGTSVQGRPILVATLTGPGDASGRTRVFFDGAHHGDEVIGSEILVRFLQRAVAEHDANATMQAALASAVVDVVPMVNPDGVARASQCSHYADCRKNARGVDLNRNYPSHWGEPGSSGNPSDATYRGPSPASEPETRVVRDLLDANDYAIYASLHSGAEMILWPWGWTTTPPPEAAVYNAFGSELSAITGAPHGQVSRILYGVSGDSMDQAYGSAAGWRAIAISPETYEGSGNAFDWWLLFNPPETDASIAPVVARWDRFLWHLVREAPRFAPARIEAPPSITLGPDAGELDVLVTGALRRPLQGASLAFQTEAGAVTVLTPNPFPLADQSGAQDASFTILPARGGDFAGTLELRAGPAGIVRRGLDLHLAQVELSLVLDRAVMGSPDPNAANVTIDAGPFLDVAGNVTLRAEPDGLILGTASFAAARGAGTTVRLAFDALSIRGGNSTIVAHATFLARDDDGASRPGQAQLSAPLRVLRPQVDLEKRFVPATTAGNPVVITAIYRNTGSSTAEDVVVRETIPRGYTYYVRDGPVPVPPDPLGRPVPPGLTVLDDGSVVATWSFGDVAPGQIRFAQYRLVALVPGTHALSSSWMYAGEFESGRVGYAGAASPAHTVRGP